MNNADINRLNRRSLGLFLTQRHDARSVLPSVAIYCLSEESRSLSQDKNVPLPSLPSGEEHVISQPDVRAGISRHLDAQSSKPLKPINKRQISIAKLDNFPPFSSQMDEIRKTWWWSTDMNAPPQRTENFPRKPFPTPPAQRPGIRPRAGFFHPKLEVSALKSVCESPFVRGRWAGKTAPCGRRLDGTGPVGVICQRFRNVEN